METQSKLKLDLFDWKVIEADAIQQIREGRRKYKLGQMIYAKAVRNIKRLGGQTAKDVNSQYSYTS